jgi:parallel beta-helix repeat protein
LVKLNFYLTFFFILFLFVFYFCIIPEIVKAKDNDFLSVGGTGEGNYSSIQEAIDTSNKGDIILVYSGNYSENIIVNKSINLIGSDKNNVTIYGNKGLYCVLIKSSCVNMSGFTIKKADVGILISGPYSDNCNISNNIISNNKDGIRLTDTLNNNISKNNISYNSNFGIVIYNSTNNSFYNNTFYENNRGISLGRWSNFNLISLNNFTGNIYGIILDYSFKNTITNNQIKNGDYGVYLTSSNNNNVTNNTINDNGQAGIYTSSSDENIITPNAFFNNNQDVWKKTRPPDIRTPGFELLILVISIFIITYVKKNK